jgi:hypothetical protein
VSKTWYVFYDSLNVVLKLKKLPEKQNSGLLICAKVIVITIWPNVVLHGTGMGFGQPAFYG